MKSSTSATLFDVGRESSGFEPLMNAHRSALAPPGKGVDHSCTATRSSGPKGGQATPPAGAPALNRATSRGPSMRELS